MTTNSLGIFLNGKYSPLTWYTFFRHGYFRTWFTCKTKGHQMTCGYCARCGYEIQKGDSVD